MSEMVYEIRKFCLSFKDMVHKPIFKPAPEIEVLKGLSFDIAKGDIVGIVGGSGSGKSTLGRAMVRLLDPSSGIISFQGRDITNLNEDALRPLRRKFQMIFQDPMSSLNPRRTVAPTQV
jgi:peptide/nickel transport system ATP-binding protein